jgi:hypothetical protein
VWQKRQSFRYRAGKFRWKTGGAMHAIMPLRYLSKSNVDRKTPPPLLARFNMAVRGMPATAHPIEREFWRLFGMLELGSAILWSV